MKNKIIVALDTVDKREALAWVESLAPLIEIFKVGSVLFTSYGPSIIEEIQKKGGKVFLDLKFHDIPKVVEGAVEAAAKMGVHMLTVHTLGGEEMLKASAGAAARIKQKPKILGVTVLTSLEDRALEKVGIKGDCSGEVKRLAQLAKECGLDGVVASARELTILRDILPPPRIIVTPGIRPEGIDSGDQKRTMTPKEAVRLGADFLVIGRPVTQAKEPLKAIEKILQDING